MGTLSDYYASVQKMLSKMNASSMQEFASHRSDEERMQYILNMNDTDEILAVKPRYQCKSSADAKRFREIGNRFYTNKRYELALMNYNHAVMLAPWPAVLSEADAMISSIESSSDFTDLSSKDMYDSAFKKATPPSTLRQDSMNELSATNVGLLNADEKSFRSPKMSRDSSVFTTLDDAGPCTELVLGLGNRSATLYQLKKYREAILDIDIALSLGFPDHLRYKLYDRKGRCMMEQGLHNDACQCFDQVISSMEHCTLTEKQQLDILQNCQKQISKCEAEMEIDTKGIGRKTEMSDYIWSMEPLIFTPSPRLPNAADGVEIRYSQPQGRYAVTSRPINVGEVVMSEAPYASVLNPLSWDKRCYHCFALLPVSPIPCQGCESVRFCSEHCQQLSWSTYHHYECQYLGLLQSSGTGVMAHLALRIMLVSKPVEVLKCITKTRSKRGSTKALFTNSRGVFLGGFVSLYNLLTHSSSRESNSMFQFGILATFLLNILKHNGFLQQIAKAMFKDPEQEIMNPEVIMGGVLLRFLQIIACNGIEITELSLGSDLGKTNPESIGLALYPTVSLLNHSCDPLVEILFADNRCIARAIQNIEGGDEINIDYGYIYYTTPKSERQKCLKAQYHFACSCVACKGCWPLKKNIYGGIPPLKCHNCELKLPVGGQKNPRQVKCKRCGSMHNPIEIFDELRRSSQICDAAIERARRFDIQRALPDIEQHITLLGRCVCGPYKEYTICVSIAKQCYRLLANRVPELTEILRKLNTQH